MRFFFLKIKGEPRWQAKRGKEEQAGNQKEQMGREAEQRKINPR